MYRSQGLYIAGRWRQAADGATLPVVDPASEEELGSIPIATTVLIVGKDPTSGWLLIAYPQSPTGTG